MKFHSTLAFQDISYAYCNDIVIKLGIYVRAEMICHIF